jgi:hypothetical protein
MNKFAKIFWPKEVSELVEKYRNEGTLNEPIINSVLNRGFFGRVALLIIASMILIFISEVKIGVGILITSPLIIYLDIRQFFFVMMASYSYGNRVKVLVSEVNGSYYGTRRLVVVGVKNNKKYDVKLFRGPGSPDSKLPKKGDEIYINVSSNKKYGATLDLPYLRNRFSLTTKFNSIINQ